MYMGCGDCVVCTQGVVVMLYVHGVSGMCWIHGVS